MRPYTTTTLILACMAFTHLLSGQVRPVGSTVIEARNEQGNSAYRFEASNKPELQQIAGAPEAHYEYFWEFGDGSYSTDEMPAHVYRDSGEVKINLSLTNNYGSGGAPRVRPRTLKVKGSPSARGTEETPALEKNHSIGVSTNNSPRAGDPIVSVLTYQNTTRSPLAGKMYLFFNEKEFDYPNFTFVESRHHHDEHFYEGLPLDGLTRNEYDPLDYLYASKGKTYTPVEDYQFFNDLDPLVKESENKYNKVVSWTFDGLQPGGSRNIFVSLEGSEEMVRDTSATISIRAVMVPDFPGESKQHTHKMVIRSSHDPNELSVSDRNINRRAIRKKGITYTVKFQNVGRGPASEISIRHPLHASLDPNSIEIVDYYPKSAFCPDADSLLTTSCLDTTMNETELVWRFRNVYLPGLRQPDKETRRATNGWISYRIKARKGFKMRETVTNRASIVFDRNEPITTNRVRTHVRKMYGISLRAGTFDIVYGFNGFSGAVGLSPFFSKKIFYQPEVGYTRFEYEGRVTNQTGVVVGADSNGDPLVGDRKITQKYRVEYVDIIPIQFRKTIIPYLSVGVGFQASALLKAQDRIYTEVDFTPQPFHVPPFTIDSETQVDDASASFPDKIEYGVFADVQGGLVRKGPSFGVRINYRPSNRPLDERAKDVFAQLYLHYRF